MFLFFLCFQSKLKKTFDLFEWNSMGMVAFHGKVPLSALDFCFHWELVESGTSQHDVSLLSRSKCSVHAAVGEACKTCPGELGELGMARARR